MKLKMMLIFRHAQIEASSISPLNTHQFGFYSLSHAFRLRPSQSLVSSLLQVPLGLPTNSDRVQRPSRDVHCYVRACGARIVKVLTFEPPVAKELMINGEPFGHHKIKEVARFSLFFGRGLLAPLFRSGICSQSPDNPTPFIIPSSTVSKSKEAS